MTPVVGPSSVLVLDGREHLRQRKLLLPPFQGSHVAAFGEVIRDVAEREVAGWTPGRRFTMRERMRSLTFEVICRAVFGVTEPSRSSAYTPVGAGNSGRPLRGAATRSTSVGLTVRSGKPAGRPASWTASLPKVTSPHTTAPGAT